jgi:hypothetical protein
VLSYREVARAVLFCPHGQTIVGAGLSATTLRGPVPRFRSTFRRLGESGACRSPVPVVLALVLILEACATSPERGQAVAGALAVNSPSCPEQVAPAGLPPGTRSEHMELAYWLERYPSAALDEPLLSPEDIQAYDVAVGRSGDALYSQRDLLRPLDTARFAREVEERLEYMRVRLHDGRYVPGTRKPLSPTELASFDAALPKLQSELRVSLAITPIRCGPFPSALHEQKPGAALATTYDRNACSSAREQEVIQILAPWPGGMTLVRTRFALGWIDAAAALSPVIPAAREEAFVRGPRVRAASGVELSDGSGGRAVLPKHATLPLLERGRAVLARERGFAEVEPGRLQPTRRPLTRRGVLTTAFQFLDSPYGFGDADGGRDCSRLLMDLFESFDLALPRHSAWQAQAGTFTLDLAGLAAADKLRSIERAAESSIVLLALPGHIMLYLGKDKAGVPMVLHALGEYARPCPDGRGESVVELARTVVTDLQVGAGSSRGALIDRMTALAAFGAAIPKDLARTARVHPLPPSAPPAQCRDSVEARVFVSPARPAAGQPVRFIATTPEASPASALWVFGPQGALEPTALHRLSGPPHGLWRRVDKAARGRYTAVFMDGEKLLGCKRVTVQQTAQPALDRDDAMIWTPRVRWERDTLGLWSAFVEQLFDGPADDEQTWTDLHTLLRDPERNLLLDHLRMNEDAALQVEPDCADLPYSLRAYFAWKLGLPFAYRECSRGRPGEPPRCGELNTTLVPRDPDDSRGPVAQFATFLNRGVRGGVHSGTGRTHPDDGASDLYPVALDKNALPPGTVYADPYGHVLIIAKWFPQGPADDAYGILLGAEAQPDGTIGRRRFFPGSFLFDPRTTDGGAGFKQFRPLLYDSKLAAIEPIQNADLARGKIFARFDLQQYKVSKEDFYERMDRLINPAPLNPHARLNSLIDAMAEAARRRVLAVDNGEQFFASGGRRPIAMPKGYDIFETQGAWEDFATPSRDMRLLIALDTVLALPASVEKYPDRFKLRREDVPGAVAALKLALDSALGAQKFSYTASDGSPRELSLRDVLDRATRLEVAYNPNDCVELRWGAAPGSPELATCKRTAPADQRARMEKYRAWFHARTRPPRGTTN